MSRYYLSPFVGTGTAKDKYRPPILSRYGIVDLRADGTDPAGWCLAWTSEAVPNPTALGLLDLGDDPDGRLRGRTLNQLESRLGVALDATTLSAIVGELLTNHARVDGTKWKPLRFNRRRIPDPDDHALTARYRGIYLGPPGQRIWEQVARDGPGTTITESFNKTDNGLGPDLTWATVAGAWSVLGNQASKGSGAASAYARAEADLATDDHYAQVEDYVQSSGSVYAGVCVRFSASVHTCYVGGNEEGGGDFTIDKIEEGSATNLTGPSGEPQGDGKIVRLEIDGSDLKGLYNGTQYATATDTAITGNTRTGIWVYHAQTDASQLDNFEAGDLGEGGSPAVATPGAIARSLTLPAPTLVGGAVATPGIISQLFTLLSSNPVAPVAVAPGVIAHSVTLPAPTVIGDARVWADVIARSLTLLSSNPVAPVAVAPGVIAHSVTLPTPTVIGSAVATPGVITIVVGVPATTKVGPAVVSPDAVSRSFVLLRPTIIIGGGPDSGPTLLLMGVG